MLISDDVFLIPGYNTMKHTAFCKPDCVKKPLRVYWRNPGLSNSDVLID